MTKCSEPICTNKQWRDPLPVSATRIMAEPSISAVTWVDRVFVQHEVNLFLTELLTQDLVLFFVQSEWHALCANANHHYRRASHEWERVSGSKSLLRPYRKRP